MKVLGADLFCANCSSSCALHNASLGVHEVPRTALGNQSGYSEVAVVTASSFPLLRSCSPSSWPDTGGYVLLVQFAKALLALAAAATLVMVSQCLQKKRCQARHLWHRMKVRVGAAFIEDKDCHCCLWVASCLVAIFRVTWMAWNPVEGQLSHIKATMDTSDFDFAAAERIVQTSRLRGVWIFFLCAALLSSVSVLRVLQRILGCAGQTGGFSFWRSMVVFLLTEASSAVALLAFTFWQQEFSTSFARHREHVSDLGFLSGAVTSSAAAAFCIGIVLSWIGPMIVTLSASTSSILFVASLRKSRGLKNPGLQSLVLGIVLTQETTAVILAIAYLHSGYVPASLLWLLGNSLEQRYTIYMRTKA